MENKIRKAIREQIKNLKEDYKPSHRAYNVIDKSNNDKIVAKELSRDKALELAHTNKDYMISATDRLAEKGMSPEEWADAKEAERLANHPEKDKINKIKKMMDKEKQDKIDTIKQIHPKTDTDPLKKLAGLKELSTELGYLNEAEYGKYFGGRTKGVDGMEGVDEQGLDQIERGINQITDGGRQSARVSDRGDKIRVMFRYMRGEFDGETWEAILEYLSDNMGYKILDQSNYYEANYDREEPAEAVPTIYLQK